MALRSVPPIQPVDRPSDDEVCPYAQCDGSGFVVDAESRVAAACRCRSGRLARARARTLQRSLPKKYAGLSFDRPPVSDMALAQPRELRDVRRYCADVGERLDAGRGLWLLGAPGTGKTTLAMLIARHAMEAHRATAVYSTARLLGEIRATFDEHAQQSAAELIDRLIGVDLLILDDLAVVRPTDWVLEQLYLIVNGRYEEERAIVFTCDLSGATPSPGEVAPPRLLAEHIGYRTYSRLVEICGDPIMMFGPDQRIAH